MHITRSSIHASARGRGLSGLFLHAKNYVNQAIRNARVRKALSLSVARFCATSHLAAIIPISVVYVPSDPLLSLQIAAYGAVACVLLTLILVLNVGLIRDEDNRPEPMLGVANKLTIIRMVLVVPLVMLVLDGHFIAALVTYVVCLTTDVFDGVVARWKKKRTEFGTIMDPVADIASTAGLFAALLAKGLIPTWVFVILMARYASLAIGCAALLVTIGPLKIRATPVGKIVGVLQGMAGIMILALAASGMQWQGNIGVVLFPFLGIIFGSVIISQLIIGVRHVSRGVADARSRG